LPKAKIFFGVVVAEWNEEITEGLYNGAEAAFLDNEVPTSHIILMECSRSFELIYGKKCCKP
jgi:6,7-dimethyl-8-ribityllumazine synthase